MRVGHHQALEIASVERLMWREYHVTHEYILDEASGNCPVSNNVINRTVVVNQRSAIALFRPTSYPGRVHLI